jgi:hypothetical protein
MSRASTLQSPKIEEALERAFRTHTAESFATDAALVAAVVVKHHGDDAGRVLELATQIAKETRAAFEPVPVVPSYVEPDDPHDAAHEHALRALGEQP